MYKVTIVGVYTCLEAKMGYAIKNLRNLVFWEAHLQIIGFSNPKNKKSDNQLLMWKIKWVLCTLY